MRKIGIMNAEIDATKIIEDSDCCLVVPAIIAREGVFRHAEGMVYYPADELKEAAWTAENAWIVAEKHPDTLILVDRKEIKGRAENARFSSDINGITANLRFYKKFNDQTFLADIKSGKRKDVSWGYYYEEDLTSGEWNGQHYDSVRRNFLVDHVAAGVPLGRCTWPYCGIAVDAVIRKVAADPWEETEEFIRSGHKEPSDTCRTIDISEEEGIKAVYCKYGEEWGIQSYLFSIAKGWTMEKAKAWFEEHKEAADADMTLEEVKQKIVELGKQRDELMNKLWPPPQPTQLTGEERSKLEGQLALLQAELEAYEAILKEKLETTPEPAIDAQKEIQRSKELLAS